MKRYTVTNNRTGYKNDYSWLAWNVAWWLVFIFGMITNSNSVGGFKGFIGKEILLDDGLFEVCLIKVPKNPLELNTIAAALLMRDIDTDLMYCFKTDKVTFESTQDIPWTLDGEFGGNHKQVLIENKRQALEIMIPE